MVTIVGVGAAAFVLSFAALRDLAKLAHIPAGWAWCLPVVIDGTIIQATLGVLVLAASRERRWFVWVLAAGAAVSIAGNSLHAVAAGHDLPAWASALVAAIAPISLLADTHGLAVLVRAAQPHSALVPDPGLVTDEFPDEAPDAATTSTIEPKPVVPVTVPQSRPAVVPVRPIRPPRPVQHEAPSLAVS
ncbi:DUF2637 domain-containing protein [Nocardia transvalensis]|uniref:DUF2637 domain-containing protein n=1 Tax=Nocardia transvalensis TaxID=37333 RepID=UPI002B4B17C5|nr:DUF2637 domain-containing protein [Nocardia transvalensis]